MSNYTNTVVGLFTERSKARQAIRELRDAGFREDQIGLMATDSVEVKRATEKTTGESNWEEGAIAGGIAGASVGGLWGVAIAMGALPMVGPVIAGGVLASVLASAAGGAAAGGIVGALLGLGIPEEDAQFYESEFKAGRTLVSVRPEGHVGEALRILRRNDGEIKGDATAPAGGPGYAYPPPLPLPGVHPAQPSDLVGASERFR